jgi:hypothetical protein
MSYVDCLWWGETNISELRPSLAYCSSPGWMWVEEPWWWWWCWMGITPDLSTRARWQPYQQRHLERVGGMDKAMRILHIQRLWYVSGSFTCHKILRRGTSGFTCHPKESVLRIFVALKNPLPQLGLNPWPLGPVASTLTTTPPRQSVSYVSYIMISQDC